MLAWLQAKDPFPPVERALQAPNGLLAAGGELSIERLLEAYRRGMFPWYSGAEPVLWWSPDPRMVLFCEELKVSRSLAKSVRNKGYEVRVDTAFTAVLEGCADRPRRHVARRRHEEGLPAPAPRRLCALLRDLAATASWSAASTAWRSGACSSANRCSRAPPTPRRSRCVALVGELRAREFPLIDCQMHTPLLASLGAREIPRRSFLRELAALVNYPQVPGKWNRVKT